MTSLLIACGLSVPAVADDWPPRTTPAEAGVDERALERFLDAARAAKSDAVVILVGGALVREEYFDRPQEPIELMSCTKSVVSLLVGMLVDDGRIPSLETPVAEWFPQWKRGEQHAVTVGHLLSRTSGLQCDRTTEEIYASRDFVKLALEAKLADPPGTRFVYNNKAVNLLAGVIETASGRRMDAFAQERLFDPLGITEHGWTKDPAGHPHAMSGLQLHAIDFAKLGQLVLQGGEWEGERIVSERWIATATRPAHPGLGSDAARCGLLWWLDPESSEYGWDDALIGRWREAGGSKRLLAVGAELRGRRFPRLEDARAALRAAVGKVAAAEGGAADAGWFDPEVNRLGVPFWNETPGAIGTFRADGYLGNSLVVCPKRRLVAVRQRRFPRDAAERDDPKYGFLDFPARVKALVPP